MSGRVRRLPSLDPWEGEPRPLAETLSEDALLSSVIDRAASHGWKTLHIRPARTSKGWRTPVQGDGRGFPDFLGVRRGVLLVAELKRHGEKPTAEQEAWLAAFRTLPFARVFVWRPADLYSGEIEEALS